MYEVFEDMMDTFVNVVMPFSRNPNPTKYGI
jgi:hypothetical protein